MWFPSSRGVPNRPPRQVSVASITHCPMVRFWLTGRFVPPPYDPDRWGRPVSRDSRNCPETVMRSARWWPSDLPSGGHRMCQCSGQVKVFTPCPVRAWESRMLSPLVWQLGLNRS